MLDDDLLSHGETPHYHRRCTVSLLSSERDQVVPVLYGRQAIRLDIRIAYVYPNWVCDLVLRVQQAFGFVSFTTAISDCLGVIWSSLTGN